MAQLNYLAPINGTGFGNFGGALFAALNERTSLSYFPLGNAYENRPGVQEGVKRSYTYDVDAPSLRVWHHNIEPYLFPGRGHRALYTFWEVDRLPPHEAEILSRLDTLFVPCEWMRQVAVKSGVRCSIEKVVPGVDTSIFNGEVEPLDVGIPEEATIFMACGRFQRRKGYDIVIEAFNKSFNGTDANVYLILHGAPAIDGKTDEWVNYAQNTPMGRVGRIFIPSSPFSSQETVASLMAVADCGVFLSRAEGWNCPAHEMAAMGKNVLLTNYGAHTEWGGPAGATFIEVNKYEPAIEYPYLKGEYGELWSNLNTSKVEEQVVFNMRNIHEQKRSLGCRLPLNRKGVEYARQNSWGATAEKVLATLS